MAVRPNFQDPLELKGGDLLASGQTHDDPLPVHIRVFVQQGDRVVGETATADVNRIGDGWTATLPSEGFHPGPAHAFGIEVRTHPFEATTWSQLVTIE
jgi:hypothetical protein